MGYSSEEGIFGRFRKYRNNSNSETISPESGHDYRIDRIKSRMGRGAVTRGHLVYPVDKPDDPMRALYLNGFMTPRNAYLDNASELARLGIATALFDTRRIINLRDIENPIQPAIDGGIHMLDIMDDNEIGGDTAAIGHSMGGLTAASIAIQDRRIDYYIGDAIAGIEHDKMWRQHLKNRKKVQRGITAPLVSMLVKRSDRLSTISEYVADFIHNPTQKALQGLMLCRDPEISRYFKVLNNIDVPIAVLLQKHDEFFAHDRQRVEIDKDLEVFGTVIDVDGAHMHANFRPLENARLRAETMKMLHNQKRKAL